MGICSKLGPLKGLKMPGMRTRIISDLNVRPIQTQGFLSPDETKDLTKIDAQRVVVKHWRKDVLHDAVNAYGAACPRS